VQDLWPEKIEYPVIEAPVAILMRQAVALGKKTGNVVEGRVEQTRIHPDRFGYSFSIVGPLLGDYSYQLFIIAHGVELYPVEILAESAIMVEVARKMEFQPREKDYEGTVVAKTQDEFENILRAIFAASKTQNVVGAIIKQSQAFSQEAV
jgi:hypothetical protein